MAPITAVVRHHLYLGSKFAGSPIAAMNFEIIVAKLPSFARLAQVGESAGGGYYDTYVEV